MFLLAALIAASIVPFNPQIRTVVSGGGGSPVVSLVGVSQQNLDPSATSIPTPAGINIQAGDLVVFTCGAGFSSTQNTTASTAPSVGTFTELIDDDDPAVDYQCAIYALVATSTQTGVIGTGTWGSSGPFRYAAMAVFRTTTGTFAIGQIKGNSATPNVLAASSTSRTAQNLTTTVANTLLVAMGIDWNGGTTHTGANSYAVMIDGSTPFGYWKQISATGTHPSGNFGTATADQYFSFFLEVSINP